MGAGIVLIVIGAILLFALFVLQVDIPGLAVVRQDPSAHRPAHNGVAGPGRLGLLHRGAPDVLTRQVTTRQAGWNASTLAA